MGSTEWQVGTAIPMGCVKMLSTCGQQPENNYWSLIIHRLDVPPFIYGVPSVWQALTNPHSCKEGKYCVLIIISQLGKLRHIDVMVSITRNHSKFEGNQTF